MNTNKGAILPGSMLGILGSGQLGRMFALSARSMGYRVHTFSPDSDTPTGQVADRETCADYEDLDAVRKFASEVDVVSFEFENVPSVTTDEIDNLVPVRPSGTALYLTQNRLREKTLLRSFGIPHAAFEPVNSLSDLRSALSTIGTPSILKTAGFGYDGKGQISIRSAEQAEAAWDFVGKQPAVLESMISFAFEFSVVAARGVTGDFVAYPPIYNIHTNHILDISQMPAPAMPPAACAESIEIVRQIFEALGLVGIACVEFFYSTSGAILVNEIAPRPHNSGHLTIEACVTSQFEQQVRAVCGLKLGSVDMVMPAAAMANLLGDLWPSSGEPDWESAAAVGDAKLHLYGKQEPRIGRKMGHITGVAESAARALQIVTKAREALGRHLS